MAAGLLTAGGGQAWEPDVVAALDRPGAPLTVSRRCADIADVLATASTGQAVACVLSAGLRRLETEALQRLTGFGLAVVVVYQASDAAAAGRLHRIGVAYAVPDDAGATAILDAVRRAVAQGPRSDRYADAVRSTADPRWALDRSGSADGGDGGAEGSSGSPERGDGGSLASPDDPRGGPYGSAGVFGGPGGDSPAAARGYAGAALRPGGTGGVPAEVSDRPAQPAGDRVGDEDDPSTAPVPSAEGTVVAVWGPIGAPGRSTVAMGIADHIARAGRTVLLIDADVYGGILATAFGLLDESAGLAGACRLAANGRLQRPDLVRLCWTVGDRLGLLTGIARADRWPEVRPSALPMVLDLARELAQVVVVDLAAVLEADEELSFDTMAPRRNGATLTLLAAADVVLAVGSADPPGIERLVRGLAELRALLDGDAPQVVLNRVRSTAADGGEAIAAVRRFADIEPVALLPYDRAACDLAWQRGVTLSAAAPASSLTAELGNLAEWLFPAERGKATFRPVRGPGRRRAGARTNPRQQAR